MNLRDLFIIYLACGAPFGVYYFLQNRNRLETKILWLKLLFRFVFWIPFALQMVARTTLFTKLYNNSFDRANELDSRKDLEIEEIKKFFENILSENNLRLSVYEFREAFERYAGLSLEIRNGGAEISLPEKEIFRITNHTNKKLAEICLHRRNRKRLSFHQKLARREFFEILDKFDAAEKQNLLEKASRLAVLLEDSEAQKTVENLSGEYQQTAAKENVKTTGEIWNPEKHKPLTETKISTNIQVLTATANLSNKD